MNSEADASSSSSLIGLLAFGVSAGIVLYFAYRQDYLTASVAATISLAAFSGYRVGAVKLLAFLFGGGIALLYAGTWGAMMVERLELAESAAPFAIGGVGLAVALCGVASGHAITHLVIKPFETMRALNCWSGLGIGALQGTAIAFLFVGGILTIAPAVRSGLAGGAPQAAAWRVRLAKTVVTVASATEGSAIGPWIEANNPFDRFAVLREAVEAATRRG